MSDLSSSDEEEDLNESNSSTTTAEVEMNGTENDWLETENIFLTGIVMNRYFCCRSLKPEVEEITEAEISGIDKNMIVWKKLHNQYERAVARFAQLTKTQLSPRSAEEIKKRWKFIVVETRRKFDESGGCVHDSPPVLKIRHSKWDADYNVDNLLLCSQEKFDRVTNAVGFKYKSQN